MRNKDRDNRIRRAKSRVKRGGIETRGRPVSSGRTKKYRGLLDDDAWEFCQAVEKYKKKTGTRFLSNSEMLTILKDLGYKKC